MTTVIDNSGNKALQNGWVCKKVSNFQAGFQQRGASQSPSKGSEEAEAEDAHCSSN